MEEAIRKAIQQMVLANIKVNIRFGKVCNIDSDKNICDLEVSPDVYLYGVKLKPTQGDDKKGITEIPKDKTFAIAMMIDGIAANWVLVKCFEIFSWKIQTESGSKIEVLDKGMVQLNGKKHGELPIIQKLVDKINALEDAHNGLVDKFNQHTHPYVDTPVGSAVTSITTGVSMDKIAVKTKVDDLKNDKVVHGDGE